MYADVSVENRIARVRLDHPPVNAFDSAGWSHLAGVFQRRREVKVLATRGFEAVLHHLSDRLPGRAVIQSFRRLLRLCAGGDVKGMTVPRPDEPVVDLKALLPALLDDRGNQLLRQIRPFRPLAERDKQLVEWHISVLVRREPELVRAMTKRIRARATQRDFRILWRPPRAHGTAVIETGAHWGQ